MKTAIVLMTAMPPTIGHGYLINWAKEFCAAQDISLGVIVGTQPQEPLCEERYLAVNEYVGRSSDPSYWCSHLHETMPQQPNGSDDKEFWWIWRNALNKRYGPIDYVISSETYGTKLAEILGAIHISCDPQREINAVKATKVRNQELDISYVLPTFRKYLHKTVTIFGAESCGKTTLAKRLSDGDQVRFIHEWARPYLESLSSPEVTEERMEIIVQGQLATQRANKKNINHCLTVQDTDILSTIGYYRIFRPHDYESLIGYKRAIWAFESVKSDLYIVCPSNIPFEADPLRYGDGVRQGTDDFWIKLLDEFSCDYKVLLNSNQTCRTREAYLMCQELYNNNPLWGFKR